MKKILLMFFVLCGFAVQVNAMSRPEQIKNNLMIRDAMDMCTKSYLSGEFYLKWQDIINEEIKTQKDNASMTHNINQELLAKDNNLAEEEQKLSANYCNDDMTNIAYTDDLSIRKELLSQKRKDLKEERAYWKNNAQIRGQYIHNHFFNQRKELLDATPSAKIAELIHQGKMNRE